MLKIRLSRTGKKHQAHYRIVVCEEHSKRDGKTIANLGHWAPGEYKITLDKKEYSSWLVKGARPTKVVQKLFAA